MDNVDGLLERAVGAGHVSGVVAMVAARGCVAYSGGHGSCSSGGAGGMTVDTVFPLSSMARPVLTVAALRLVDSGLLRLDEPLQTVLPELTGLRRLTGFDSAWNPVHRPVRGAVTLRRLLNHTSGLLDGALAGGARRAGGSVSVSFEPGSRWLYGGDMTPVGMVIERVSGMSVADYLRKGVFDALDMRRTGFDAVSSTGGVGFYSTPRDYFAFVEALLRCDGTLLSRESGELVRRNQIGSLSAPRVLGAGPVRVPGEMNFYPEIRLYPESERKWSLGFMVNLTAIPGGPGAGSLTCASSGAYCWMDPTSGVAGLLFARRTVGGPDLSEKLFGDFQRSVYAAWTTGLVGGRRRKNVFEHLFQGWSSDVWATWWPM